MDPESPSLHNSKSKASSHGLWSVEVKQKPPAQVVMKVKHVASEATSSGGHEGETSGFINISMSSHIGP